MTEFQATKAQVRALRHLLDSGMTEGIDSVVLASIYEHDSDLRGRRAAGRCVEADLGCEHGADGARRSARTRPHHALD
jgi:hypothetical protein